MTKEANEYILGTNSDELHRLGLQHQVWASEAHTGWEIAGFSAGDTLLDLGSGPGFCSTELAYIVGDQGEIIAVDKSKNYINFIQQTSDLHSLNIEAICSDFDDLKLIKNTLDGMYCRWALAWISNPREVLEKVYAALKPGGKMVIQEYFDWSTHQTIPNYAHLDRAIASCLKSFKDQPGDIDVGKELPSILTEMGMEISTRPLAKFARPDDQIWQWPKSFYEIYFPKLAEMNYLSAKEVNLALEEFRELEKNKVAHLFCPTLIEVVATKV